MARNWSYFRSANGPCIAITGRWKGSAAAARARAITLSKLKSASASPSWAKAGADEAQPAAQEPRERGLQQPSAVHLSPTHLPHAAGT